MSERVVKVMVGPALARPRLVRSETGRVIGVLTIQRVWRIRSRSARI